MKSFKEFNRDQLDEGILDTIKKLGSGALNLGKKVLGGITSVATGFGGNVLRNIASGSGGYDSKYDSHKDEVSKLKKELDDLKSQKSSSGSTPTPAPKATGTQTPTPAPKATGTSTTVTTPPSGLGPKPTTPPTGVPKKVPSPTGSSPVPPAPATPAVPAPAAPVPAPVKTLTKSEKKDRREISRTSGGITQRLGKIESNPKDNTSFRAARTDPAKEKLAAKGADLEAKRAAIQTTTGNLKKGVKSSDIRNFNVSQEITKGNIIRNQSIAKNPELANRLAAVRARLATKRSKLATTGSTPAEKNKAVIGRYESTELVNSVMKFLNK